MRQLLSGITVVELAEGIAGSYCGKLFADLGADVVAFAVEVFEFDEVDSFDVAADAAFGEGEHHPGFEVLDDFGFYFGMVGEIEV